MTKYALTNGIILDGTLDMVPITNKTLFIEGDRIVNIDDEKAPTDGYTVIDLEGKYILPGLVNMHVHLPGSGKPKKKETDNVKLVKLITSNALFKKILEGICAANAKTAVMSGITTIRTVGGVTNVDSHIRNEINRGLRIGPRMLVSNMAVSVPGGHMAGSLAYDAKTPEDGRKYVRMIAGDKPDLIKLMITGGVLDATVKGEPGVLKMDPSIISAACEEAHRHGLKVAAHVESPDGVRAALKNGVDFIEHGAQPDDEIIDLFKEKGASLTTTLSPALPFALFDTKVSHATYVQQYNGKIVFDGIVECAKKCLEEDIPVGLGTDTACPYVTHYGMWRELLLFCKYCNVSANFAIHTATLVNAGLLGLGKETGSIETGKCADLLICKDNPLEDLRALSKPDMVFARGRKLDKLKVKKFRSVEKELDKFM